MNEKINYEDGITYDPETDTWSYPDDYVFRVIEFKNIIYAWVDNQLYQYFPRGISANIPLDTWTAIESLPEGLLITNKGLTIADSREGQEWLTFNYRSLCCCSNETLLNKGCGCGGV